MDAELEEKPKAPVSGRRYVLARFCMILLLAVMSPIVAARLGYHFLPSVDWVKSVRPFSIVLGLVSAFGCLFLLISRLNKQESLDNEGVTLTPGKTVLVVVFCPLLVGLLAHTILPVGVPMIYALVAGGNMELHFIVSNPDGSSSRSCRRKITLEGLPFVFDEMCGFSNDLRHKLRRGSKILVTGYGTKIGIFPGTITIE